MSRSTTAYLQDILDEMDRIERFASSPDADDEKTTYAISKAFENMGEAAKHVPDGVRTRAPEVMWREMAGMRDRLAHAYWGVELRFAWLAIQERFPVERPALRQLLDDLDAAGASPDTLAP